MYVSPRAQAVCGKKPLRILFVAPQYDYGIPARGLSIEENYFFHAIVEMGHEVIRFDYMDLQRRLGRKEMNHMLLECSYRFNPDLMFVVLFTDQIDPDVIETISRSGQTVTLNWFCDDHWRFETYARLWAPRFNWVITTAMSALPKYKAAGIHNVIFSQWACNHRLCFKMNLGKAYDISFVGLPHGNRREIVSKLRSSGLDVKVWGHGWDEGRITQREMVAVFNQSRINLNLSNSSMPGSQQIKGRVFEVAGCGGFLLTDLTENIVEYFDVGKEIICFDGIDELMEKTRYYLSNEKERSEIAEAAYTRTLREHTYEHRFSKIFDKIGLG